MSKRAEAYFKKLENCCSEDLDRSAIQIASNEKQNVAHLIAHIAEIGERKYHLKLGYPNLFEYCVRRLNLGEPTVSRRTQVAGVCRRFPQLLESLHAGRLHLTGASLIAPRLTVENAESLIASAEGKSRRKLLEFLAALSAKEEFAQSLRRQPSGKEGKSELEDSEELAKDLPAGDGKAAENRSGRNGGRGSRDLLEPATEDRYNFRFSAGTELVDKFHRAAEVLNISSPHCHIDEVFDKALEALLEKKDPKRRQERRKKREAKKPRNCPGKNEKSAQKSEKEVKVSQKSESGSSPVSRYLPSEVRERVLEKAGYQCEYCGPDGERCSSRTGLEIDHSLPFSVYHSNDEAQLRVLCRAHNLFEAEEYFGRGFVRGKIKARQCVR